MMIAKLIGVGLIFFGLYLLYLFIKDKLEEEKINRILKRKEKK